PTTTLISIVDLSAAARRQLLAQSTLAECGEAANQEWEQSGGNRSGRQLQQTLRPAQRRPSRVAKIAAYHRPDITLSRPSSCAGAAALPCAPDWFGFGWNGANSPSLAAKVRIAAAGLSASQPPGKRDSITSATDICGADGTGFTSGRA